MLVTIEIFECTTQSAGYGRTSSFKSLSYTRIAKAGSGAVSRVVVLGVDEVGGAVGAAVVGF